MLLKIIHILKFSSRDTSRLRLGLLILNNNLQPGPAGLLPLLAGQAADARRGVSIRVSVGLSPSSLSPSLRHGRPQYRPGRPQSESLGLGGRCRASGDSESLAFKIASPGRRGLPPAVAAAGGTRPAAGPGPGQPEARRTARHRKATEESQNILR